MKLLDLQIRLKRYFPWLFGFATYLPAFETILEKMNKSVSARTYARYCYSVWLRHLIMLHENGLSTQPDVIVELGPGTSFGVGLSALLTGAKKYYALDAVECSNNRINVKVFDEVLNLIKNKERIPDETEFHSNALPYLQTDEFPHHILTDDRLSKALQEDNLRLLRNSLLNMSGNKYNGWICYELPLDETRINENSVDMVLSQWALEHVGDLAHTYKTLYRLLKPNGIMSLAIDFASHGYSLHWNGHWVCSDFSWRIMTGKRPYLLNRQPHSTHINLMKNNNFRIVCDIKVKKNYGIQRKNLHRDFIKISNDDLNTFNAFIQAVKVDPI